MNSKYFFAFLPALLLACGSSTDSGGAGGSGNTGAGATAGSGATPASGGSSNGTGGSTNSGGSGVTGGASPTGGAGNAGGAGPQCLSAGTLTAQPVNNYTFTSDITLTPAKLKANSELMFDWSMVNSDFMGRPINPKTDIDSALLVLFHDLTVEQLEEHVNADDGSLTQFNAGALQLLTNNTLTSASLYDFAVPGTTNTYRTSADVKAAIDTNVDPTKTDPSNHVFALMLEKGTGLGVGARMIQAFTIDPTSQTTSITLGPSTRVAPGTGGHTGGTTGPSTSLVFDVDLEHLTPVGLPAGQANVMVDWSGMTTNALGRDWQSRSISKITVGHYTQTLSELETKFLDLESIAQDSYSADVPSDEPISLSTLKNASGQSFAGIDDTGTWIVALFCTVYCSNPAPWYLTIVKPCK
jgi:hypothetical protein